MGFLGTNLVLAMTSEVVISPSLSMCRRLATSDSLRKEVAVRVLIHLHSLAFWQQPPCHVAATTTTPTATVPSSSSTIATTTTAATVPSSSSSSASASVIATTTTAATVPASSSFAPVITAITIPRIAVAPSCPRLSLSTGCKVTAVGKAIIFQARVGLDRATLSVVVYGVIRWGFGFVQAFEQAEG
ncbi:hypothetical protein TCAL_16097, partial [Tigriopus californicus]